MERIMDSKYIIIPLVGAFIGYITNSIAITMLFRPREAKYIGKWQIPFTPGIIPKERARLSKAIARVICEDLLNSEVVSRSLLSYESIEKLTGVIDAFFQKYSESNMTVGEALNELTGNSRTTDLAQGMTVKVSDAVSSGLERFSMGEAIAITAITNIRDDFSSAGGYKAILSRFLDEKLIDALSPRIGAQINTIVRNKAPEMVNDFVEKEAQNITDMPCRELVSRYKDDIPKIKSAVVSVYRGAIENYLPQLIKSLDLYSMLEKRINGFEMGEAENIIRSVINRELKAIIWLGALLGLVIGLLNLLFV